MIAYHEVSCSTMMNIHLCDTRVAGYYPLGQILSQRQLALNPAELSCAMVCNGISGDNSRILLLNMTNSSMPLPQNECQLQIALSTRQQCPASGQDGVAVVIARR